MLFAQVLLHLTLDRCSLRPTLQKLRASDCCWVPAADDDSRQQVHVQLLVSLHEPAFQLAAVAAAAAWS